MDGRLKLCLAGGLVAAVVGCNTTQKQLVPDAPPAAKKPVTTPAQFAKATQATAPPATAPRANLKPETYVTMGDLKEQAAEEGDRPGAEREAFRQQARQSYQQALATDPRYLPAFVALARSYAASEEKDKTQAMFAKALALAPNDANLWYEQGACLARMKDFPAAVQSLNKAAELAPDNATVQKLLGFTLARGGWYEEALNALVRSKMPEAEARYNLARMMQHNRHGDAADTQLRLAVQMDPNNDAARSMLVGAQPGETGVQQTSYQNSAAAVAPAAPQRVDARVPPVTLGGSEPAPIGTAGRGE